MRVDWANLVGRALQAYTKEQLTARQIGEHLHVTLRRQDGSSSSVVVHFVPGVDVDASPDQLLITVDGKATTVGSLRRRAVWGDRWRRCVSRVCFWRR